MTSRYRATMWAPDNGIERTVDQRSQRAQEQLLNQACLMRFRKETSVQKANRKPAADPLSFVLTCQELLCDRVPIVVGQHVEPSELSVGHQCLTEVGLLHDAVSVSVRLVELTRIRAEDLVTVQFRKMPAFPPLLDRKLHCGSETSRNWFGLRPDSRGRSQRVRIALTMAPPLKGNYENAVKEGLLAESR